MRGHAKVVNGDHGTGEALGDVECVVAIHQAEQTT